MDNNNWRPSAPGGEPAMDAVDWRTQLSPDSRQRIVNKIMETLKRHLPFSGQEGIMELKKIAERFEEKIYSAATSQSDYLRRISMKMLTMENKSQGTMPNSMTNPSTNSSKPLDAGASMQTQVPNQGQTAPIQLSANQLQVQQPLLSQNMPSNNMISAVVQGSAGLQSTLPPVSGLNQTPIRSMVNQNPNMQNVSQNSVGNSMGQGVSSNMFANSQRQMPGRQQVVPQQQQQTSQNSQQFLYHQQQIQQQQQLLNKFQQGNLSNTIVQPHMQQTQLQNPQPSSMQTSSMVQPSMIQSSAHSSLQQNPPSSVQQSTHSMLQRHPQLRPHQQPQQTASIHQQQTPTMQYPLLPSQQQQLLGQSSNATNVQQNQLIGQTSAGEMQQQQRMLGQQNNIQSLQQQQQQQQRQLMSQKNNLTGMNQQQSNVSRFQQQQQHQQLLGTQSSNSSMQNAQHPAHMMQQTKIPLQHQAQQNVPNLLGSQGQQSQMQPGQQQIMSQMQSQPTQMQQLGMQQQQQHQRLQSQVQAPGSLLQAQNVIDQQKQEQYQAQRPHAETSSTSLDSTAQTGNVSGGDWQEEVYQKIKAMKEKYLPELNDMYQKIAAKLQQHDSLPQQPKSEQLDKLKIFKKMLERIIAFLQVSKNSVLPGFKEKLSSYEMQILNCLNSNRPRKPLHPMQQAQLGQSHMQSMQQSQPLISQAQPHENQINPQMQSMNSQDAGQTTQQSNVLHNSMSSLPGVSAPQQNVMNSLQPGSSMDSAQGNQLSSMQQVTSGPIQQGTVSAPQQSTINPLTTQSGVNMVQTNIPPLQPSSNMLQHQHPKQQQEMLQSQKLKQIQQRQYFQQQQQQMLQQQQQLQQQNKQLLPVQMQTHQVAQLNQMNDMNEMKLRVGMGVKPGVFQQHLQSNQRPAYPHQQIKPGGSYPISPSQLLQATSPQLPQHSSPQIDQQNLLSSLTKTGTPLQSAGSPFVVPSPSTSLAPSPMPGDTEKPISGVSSLVNAANVGHQQTSSTQVQAPSLAIGTPGISASPLLAEFTGTDALPAVCGKSTVTEQPLERLIRVVKSMDSKALSASVSDIGSVVSMIDRIAGSAPGNGSRAAVGEDLVAMTKCRLQAKNFITQDGLSGNRKMRRHTSAMPLNVVSSAGSVSDSFKRLLSPETSDLESTATSRVKRPRFEANHALLEEIREINQQLIDTVVDISDEDVDPTTAASAVADGGEGTVVKCSFGAVALCPTLKAQYASKQTSPIQPLRLLVPTNYPSCSPVLLDKLPVEVSKEYEDISMKAKSKFSISLRSLSQPMSLGDIARTWDFCARAVISEHAQRSGGGTFSSKYGTWENCLNAV